MNGRKNWLNNILRGLLFILICLLMVLFMVACNPLNDGNKNSKLSDDTYIELKHEMNENNELGFILVVEKLEYITIKEYSRKEVWRNKNDNDNPYRASIYLRTYNEASNTYEDELIGKFMYYQVKVSTFNSYTHLLQANEVPNKYKLTKGRVVQ